MRLTLSMDKRLDAAIATDKCINCDSCSGACPVSAIEEKERKVEGLQNVDFNKVLPSSKGCPLGIVPQTLVELIRANRLEDAAQYLYRVNPFAKICSSLCDGYCRRSDRRGILDGNPIDIRELERFILDKYDGKPYTYSNRYDEKIAIIGGGPSGISAAYRLAKLGYHVTILEKDNHVGGAMSWGIPGFRLDKDVMDGEISRVLTDSIEVKCGVNVGEDVTLEQLRQDYDAVVLAVGASHGAVLELEGSDGNGTIDGVSVLREINMNPEQRLESVGDTVVVIGGGRFAVDVSRTLARKGKDVTCVAMERKDNLQMPLETVTTLAAEGIKFAMQAVPTQIVRQNDKVVAIDFGKVTYKTNEDGIIETDVDNEDGFTVDCDTVVFAVGRKMNVDAIGKIDTYEDGAVDVDNNNKTSVPHVFACGDVTGTTNSVVAAIVSGQKTAEYIDTFLRGRKFPKGKAEVTGLGSAPAISRDKIAMIRPQRSNRLFSQSSKLEAEPAENIEKILEQAGIEEDMPHLINQDAEDYALKKRVAVIGGGVAGISAAIKLAKDGYAPTIYEKSPCLGGRYRWLATDKRINRLGLEEKLAKVTEAGIPVIFNASAGIKPTINELKAEGYDAIAFAIGESVGKKPDMHNANVLGIFEIVSLASRLSRDLIINGIGDRVIVTGGDELAVDVARKLKEYAKDVTLICQESRGMVLVNTCALDEALEEGVNLVTGTKLIDIAAVAGKVSSAKLHIDEKDIDIDVPCDTLVMGETQKPDTATIIARNTELEADDNGELVTDDKLRTSIDGVLSIGTTTLPSAEAGHALAEAVESYLSNSEFDYNMDVTTKAIDTPNHEILEGKTIADKGFEIGQKIYSEEQANKEASRFISVGYHQVNSNRCIGCGLCVSSCPEYAIELTAYDGSKLHEDKLQEVVE